MLTDAQVIAKYGQPGDPHNLITLTLPYPMRIDWDRTKTVSHIQCHTKIAGALLAVFQDLLAHYGLAKIQELGIDLFAGCLNVRLQRGSTTVWSRHAWAIAIDLDPQRNGLHTKWVDAQFSKPEYKFMVGAFHTHGFIGYGPDRNFDAMHWEINS